jgi:hypothetical protein
VLCLNMQGIHRHYAAVKTELLVDDEDVFSQSRVHAIVLVSTWHKPTQRTLMYAKATNPDTLTALTVNADDADTRALLAQWEAEHRHSAQGHRIALPRDHPTRRRLHQAAAKEGAARRYQRVYPRIRRRAVVGKRAAQPKYAAAQGTVAVRTCCYRHQRALAAPFLRAPQSHASRTPGR